MIIVFFDGGGIATKLPFRKGGEFVGSKIYFHLLAI